MKIFLSSTILDLQDLRHNLKRDLETDGHDVITSEDGTVPVEPGLHSYELCLKAAAECDCLIAMIDKRFGGEYPKGSNKSITEAEIETALEKGIKTLVYVRKSVWDSWANQKAQLIKNGIAYQSVKNIVDDPRVFELLNRLAKRQTNNWIFQFNNSTDLLGQIRAQIGKSASTPTPQIEWLQRCTELLADRQSTVTKALGLESRSLSDVHVPLGLIERKQQPKVDREPDPAMGSQLYQQPDLKEVKRFEHQAFLDDVVRDRACGKHIAIIGEPGAGKTTLLAKIGEWLIANPGDAEVVAWISLADLQGQNLSDYFCGDWLKSVHPSNNHSPEWQSQLESLIQDQKVWLLLDGLDEMAAEDLLRWINKQLEGSWGKNLRVVLTCRLNLWDGGSNVAAERFEVFRTLDYDYVPKDRIKDFIYKWFTSEPDVDPAAAQQKAKALRAALDEPGKERIKDLVKNPLRLTLLCASWKDGQGLPDTQANLYQQFVNWFNQANESKSSEKVAQQDKRDQQQRDQNLGKLAKLGLNRAEGLGRRFRFTEREMQDLWQDGLTTLTAVKRLGWLNCVGMDETSNKVYAFFHPTFQEYFAACSIEAWDYFLPEAHTNEPIFCQTETSSSYRIFQPQWRQVMLLWIGRESDNFISRELINKLIIFEEQNANFFYHYAYCLAVVLLDELSDLSTMSEIVDQVIDWGLGNQKNNSILSLMARETIALTKRSCVEHLIEKYNSINEQIRESRERVNDATYNQKYGQLLDERHNLIKLFKTAIDNRQVIDLSINLINTDLRRNSGIERHRTKEIKSAIELLGEIAIDDPSAINCLVGIISSRQHTGKIVNRTGNIGSTIKKSLISISTNNEGCIQGLIQALDCENKVIWEYVMGILKVIAINNSVAIKLLNDMINQKINEDLKIHIMITLVKIKPDNKIELCKQLLNLDLDYLSVEQRKEVFQYLQCTQYTQGLVNESSELYDLFASLIEVNSTEKTEQLQLLIAMNKTSVNYGNNEIKRRLKELFESANASQFIVSDISNFIEIMGKFKSEFKLGIIKMLLSIESRNLHLYDYLIQLLEERKQNMNTTRHILYLLEEYASENSTVHNHLLHSLQQDLSSYSKYHIANIIANINPSNNELMDYLYGCIRGDNSSLKQKMAIILVKISLDNEVTAIDILINAINHKNERAELQQVLDFFPKIKMNKSQTASAIRKLIEFLTTNENTGLKQSALDSLTPILQKDKMGSVLSMMKEYLNDGSLSDKQACNTLVWHCARVLSYSEFYNAWHKPSCSNQDSI